MNKSNVAKMFEIEEITTTDRFDSLRPAWEIMMEQGGIKSPFLSHEWFHCCLCSYARDLFVLIVKNGSRVCGMAPFWRREGQIRGIRLRIIEFISCPDTPFVDLVLQREGREEALKTIFNYLFTEKKGDWDLLTLNGLSAESENYAPLKELLGKQKRRHAEKTFSLIPYIPIEGDWETFLQSRTVRFKKARRNIVNRINKRGKVEIQCFGEDHTGAVYQDMLTISERSWKHKEGIAISSRQEFMTFFKELNDVAGQKGWLRVWLLKLDNVPVAMEYDLEHAGNVYALRADFDEAYKETSPGAYLEYMLVKKLFERGLKEYNTGPGLNTYKLRWTDKMRTNVAMDVYNNSLKGNMMWVLEGKLVPLLRRIKDKLPFTAKK